MSAFLGPIHHKMYDKIRYQDDMAQTLLEKTEENGWADGLRTQVDSTTPGASKHSLEDIIDQSNIHGWLSAAVANSEARFAAVVCGVLIGHSERLETMQSIMRQWGEKQALPGGISAEEAFAAIHDILLDGMPCDFPFQMLESGADEATWKVTACPHAPYWVEADCGVETYYQLRDAWMEGALAGTGLTHSRENGQHCLRKEQL